MLLQWWLLLFLLARLESAYSLNAGVHTGKRSGYFMIIRWQINCFVYKWRNLRASMRTSNVATSFFCKGSFTRIVNVTVFDLYDVTFKQHQRLSNVVTSNTTFLLKYSWRNKWRSLRRFLASDMHEFLWNFHRNCFLWMSRVCCIFCFV